MTSASNNPRGLSSERMPVLFVGHGSPLHAIVDNVWSRGFRQLGHAVPSPKAVLVVSAHWSTEGTLVTTDARPKTLHDFGGFPRALHEVQYPAPGSPDLAQQLTSILQEHAVRGSADWGLDHGSWSVLRHMYPGADVPVLQLSIDRRLNMKQHFELGRGLSGLRDEGVLILGSGNITHNLADALRRMQSGLLSTPDWALRFDHLVKQALTQRDTRTLLSAQTETADGRLSHPSPEHWLPLLYAYGASDAADAVHFPQEGFDGGSLSMRSVRFG